MPAPKPAILVINCDTPPGGWPKKLSGYEIVIVHELRAGLETLRRKIEEVIMIVVCPRTDKNKKMKIFFRRSRVLGFNGAMLIPESAEAAPRVILEHLQTAAHLKKLGDMVPGTQWLSFQKRRSRSPYFPLRA